MKLVQKKNHALQNTICDAGPCVAASRGWCSVQSWSPTQDDARVQLHRNEDEVPEDSDHENFTHRHNYVLEYITLSQLVYAFSALTLLVGRQQGHPACKKLSGAGVVMCLGRGADLHMALLMPLRLTISCSSKSRLALPSWFYLWCRLTRMVPYKIQEGRKRLCVCVCKSNRVLVTLPNDNQFSKLFHLLSIACPSKQLYQQLFIATASLCWYSQQDYDR